MGEDETQHGNKVLSFNYISKDQILVITSYRVDFYHQRTRKTVFQFYGSESEFAPASGTKIVFGKTVKIDEREVIMIVDSELTLYLYDFARLRHDILDKNKVMQDFSESAIVELSLIKDSRYFDHALLKPDD